MGPTGNRPLTTRPICLLYFLLLVNVVSTKVDINFNDGIYIIKYY